MAQMMTINLSKGEAPNLGFRLQGGVDFAAPLVIQKVNGGSPADKAGLFAGDSVIKINNTDVYNLRHKDAQDVIIRAGPSFTITVQRGGSTWKPSVVPTGPTNQGNYGPVTKTSLAAKPQASIGAIGTGHNTAAKPFLNGTANGGPKLVNKQYNSPIGIYSDKSIAETLTAQSEVLSTGVLGVNFKKNEKNYDATKSAVYSMLQEAEKEPRSPEPDVTDSGVVTSPLSGIGGLKHFQAPENKPAPPTPQLPPGQNICADCERLIVGVFVRIKDKNLHVECFKCSTCGASLKNVGYYNINNKLYCDVHAKLAAKSNPPAPNLVPVTVPPGGRAPAGTISAALSSHPLPTAAPLSPKISPLSPGSNISAAPFQKKSSPKVPPDELDINDNIKNDKIEARLLKSLTIAASKKSNASPECVLNESNQANQLNFDALRPSPISYSQFMNKSNYTTAPRPFSSVSAPLSPSNYNKPLPRSPILAPAQAPFTSAPAPAPTFAPSSTPGYLAKPSGGMPKDKGRPVQNIVWPPLQEEPDLPTACPLYFPPPSTIHVHHSREISEKVYEESIGDQTDKDISELEDYTNLIKVMDPKMSLCSSEVCNITGRRSAAEVVESLGETLQTQMLIDSIVKQRPKSPPPLDVPVMRVAEKTECKFQAECKEVKSVCSMVCNKSCCNDTCETCPLREPADLKRPQDYERCESLRTKVTNAIPHKYESPMLTALKTAPAKPLSIKTDMFSQIPQKQSSSAFASALSIAPSEPFNPVPPVYTTLEPVPLPEETVPYFPPAHPMEPIEPKTPKKEILAKPDSPFVDALKIAPDRPFTPVGGARPGKKKSKEDPLFKDLPKPQETMSMLAALTTAPDRSYSPLIPDIVTPSNPPVEDKVKQKEAERRRKMAIKQPTPQPYISTMVNNFEGSEEKAVGSAAFPPVSIQLQQHDVQLSQHMSQQSELVQSCQRMQQSQQVNIEQMQKKEERTIMKQAEEIVLKKPMQLTSSLHRSDYLPQYQTSLQYDEELQLPHNKSITKLLQANEPKSKIVPEPGPLLRPQPQLMQTPPPQIIKPVRTIQPDDHNPNIQRGVFEPVHDDFHPPNSAFSQRVAQRPLTPSRINKPPSAIPYYQQNLVATEYLAPEVNLYDPKSPAVSRSPSPCLGMQRSASPFGRASPRPKSPAPGPPPNPLKKHVDTSAIQKDLQVERAKDSVKSFIPQHRDKYQQMLRTEGQAYDDTRSISEHAQAQHTTVADNYRREDYQARAFHAEDSEKHQTRQIGDTTTSISERAKLEQLQALNKSQTQSSETSADNRVQIQRTKTVTEEFEHMHKEKVIEIEHGGPKMQQRPFQKVNVPAVEEHGIIGLHVTNPQPLHSPFKQKEAVPEPPRIVTQPQALSRSQPPPQTPQRPVPAPQPPSKFKTVVPPIAAPTTSQSVKPTPDPSAGTGGRQSSSVFAPKRGRGVLNTGGLSGARIPLCASCHQQIRYWEHETETEIVCTNDKVQITTKTIEIGKPLDSNYNQINVTIPLPAFSPSLSSDGSLSPSSNSTESIQPRITNEYYTSTKNNYLETTFPTKYQTSELSETKNNNTQTDLTYTCICCNNKYRGPFITALGKIWCPDHFVCNTPSCKRPLQDIGFVEEQGQLHCEYCFERYLAPDCSKCNAKIKGDCLKAIGKNFHPECFACAYCGKLFGNNPFFMEDGLPYCETDWNEMFTTKCFACGFPVEAGDRWVEALNNNYHSQCFNCTMCKKNLEGQSFFAKGGRPYCKTHAR